ncbi:BglG family transcription antiterminator [Paraliobacillus sp. X-1268]|uniref:BglG family transcription antiterminator n=1 Tax=Paraliobacillus sp. X-1268 TaxID=2213193 RepID=UPI000E3CA935|nr:BglG family transcription antiterminator [Paraliobacillus sp. X-1268]
MNTRHQQILKELIRESTPVTSEHIASLIQVTSRTIRNDIKQLNQILRDSGAKIISERGHGYHLDIIEQDNFKNFIHRMMEMEDSVPVEPEDRVHYLVKKFLLNPNYLKIEDLADDLFVSRSTLKNDLKDVKVVLSEYHLSLMKRPNYGLKLSGEEKHVRYCIAEVLFSRTASTAGKTDKQWLLPADQMDEIRLTVLKRLKEFQLNLSDIALDNLVVHIAIACRRIKSEQYVEQINNVNADDKDTESEKEHQVAKMIIKDIESTVQLTFPKVEISYVAMHLLGTKIFLNKNQSEIVSNFDQKIIQTVDRLVYQVEEQMKLGISKDSELYAGIAIHLKPAIHRYKNHMNIRNPMLEAIKVNYPVAFEAGVIASRVIEHEHNILIDENEIGYIALHFGAAIERTKLQVKPKRCLIVCTTGRGSSQLLLYKMRAKFGNQLTIIGATELHNLPKYNEDDIDFIVSTVTLPDSVNIPYIVVSTLLGSGELDKITQVIEDRSISLIDKYLDPNLIYLHLSCSTPIDVITFLGNELVKQGRAKEGIIASIMERENAASTSYGNLVAIPHPLIPKSDQTFWTLATLEKPIDWAGSMVQFVCLLHVADENQEKLEPMYKNLIKFVDSRETIKQLINCENKQEVLDILRRM